MTCSSLTCPVRGNRRRCQRTSRTPSRATSRPCSPRWLVNATHVKRVPGRKTDVTDAEWLADVAAHGMVRPSYVPPPPIRALRELTRYRKTQVDARTREVQRLEKALQDAGIKLSSVASGTWSQSARAMVSALIAGEREPEVLADLAKSRMRAKKNELALALDGHFADHHGIVAQRIMDHIAFLEASIGELSAAISERLTDFEPAIDLLCEIPGWGRTTAEVFIAETGADMSVFPTPGQLASWAGVAPGTNESAGKRKAAASVQRQPVARAGSDRSGPRCRPHEGHLPCRPLPPARRSPWTEQGRHCRRPHDAGDRVAPSHDRRAVPRSRRRLLRQTAGPRPPSPAPHPPARATRVHRRNRTRGLSRCVRGIPSQRGATVASRSQLGRPA
jgi:transposase